MAKTKTDPTSIDDLGDLSNVPSKTEPSNWLLIVENVFPRWCDRLGSSKDAKAEVDALLRDPETRSAKHKVDASGKEIPGTASEFVSERLIRTRGVGVASESI
jgi:hypothetical protein